MERHAALHAELTRAREQTDMLFSVIAPEAVVKRPVSERHRLIFYLGHFDAFDWNLLARRGLSAASFQPAFDSLFERGIDPPPGQTPDDKAEDWPRTDEVHRYIAKTREWIDLHLNEMDEHLLQMAVEHRQMHAETFAYLLHNLPPEDKRGTSPEAGPRRPEPPNPMIDIKGGKVTLGQQDSDFGWDNERRAHDLPVADFSISKFKVTNGAWLRFAAETGSVPNFWRRRGSEWLLRGVFGDIPLPLDHPVWVTWEQADAYARWRGMSLPSEAQYGRAAQLFPSDPARDNYGLHRWGTVPVDHGNEHRNGHAPLQMTGNGWEWTRDVFAPFAGFEPHPFYPGYSADFFDREHYVLKGASPRTATLLARPSFRNWFRREYPHMYAGFRLVKD